MREILFRGKRLDNGEWAEGAYLNDRDGAFYICPAASDITYGDNGNRRRIGCWYKVDPATVGQFTGLEDKNGKKIFEGDIWDCSGCIGVIKWVDEVCSFEANYVMHGIEYANAVSDYRAAKVEVIGNIHDNPELLGGDES
jgi:uncharacterized phage protein (TIGR01671 family)